MQTEEGREKLRNGSFSIDATAQSLLEAAVEELGAADEGSEDAKQAKVRPDAAQSLTRTCTGDDLEAAVQAAAERIKGGGEDELARRVKKRTVGFGQTS